MVEEIKKLKEENRILREGLEFECGKRCAIGINPCNARQTLEEADKVRIK